MLEPIVYEDVVNINKIIPKTIEIGGLWYQDNYTIGNTYRISKSIGNDEFGANVVPKISSQLYTKRRIEF